MMSQNMVGADAGGTDMARMSNNPVNIKEK